MSNLEQSKGQILDAWPTTLKISLIVTFLCYKRWKHKTEQYTIFNTVKVLFLPKNTNLLLKNDFSKIEGVNS